VAKRPNFAKPVLTREDLAELQQRLSQMSVWRYRISIGLRTSGAGLDENHFPTAQSLQELVQAWKQMRGWR